MTNHSILKKYRLDQEQKAKRCINALDNVDKEIRKGSIEQAMNTLLINQANIIQTDEPEKILEYLRKQHD